MTAPIERIKEQYRLHPQEQPFEFYLNWHLANGFVFSTPDYFVMGRAMVWAENESWTRNRIDEFTIWAKKAENAWYVHAMAGDIKKAWGILPYPLGYICFERVRGGKRELVKIPTERMRKLAHALFDEPMAEARL